MTLPHTALELEVRDQWNAFLQRKTAMMAGGNLGIVAGPAFAIRFPPLTEAVAALLYIDGVSILDASMATQLGEDKCAKLKNLHNRIEALREAGMLLDPDACRRLRGRRNELAHDAEGKVGVTELDDAVRVIHAQFQAWEIVGTMPAYQFFAERSGARESDRAGTECAFDYKVGVKREEREVLRFSWTEYLHADDNDK